MGAIVKNSVADSPDGRIADLRRREAETFRKARPKSETAIGNGISGYLGGERLIRVFSDVAAELAA